MSHNTAISKPTQYACLWSYVWELSWEPKCYAIQAELPFGAKSAANWLRTFVCFPHSAILAFSQKQDHHLVHHPLVSLDHKLTKVNLLSAPQQVLDLPDTSCRKRTCHLCLDAYAASGMLTCDATAPFHFLHSHITCFILTMRRVTRHSSLQVIPSSLSWHCFARSRRFIASFLCWLQATLGPKDQKLNSGGHPRSLQVRPSNAHTLVSFCSPLGSMYISILESFEFVKPHRSLDSKNSNPLELLCLAAPQEVSQCWIGKAIYVEEPRNLSMYDLWPDRVQLPRAWRELSGESSSRCQKHFSRV